MVGLGESLYYDERFNAAAECFSLALARDDGSNAAARDRLFDWWAGALDQQAQIGPELDRKGTYQQILDRADAELRKNDRAAAAGWIRAPSTGARAATLRADLDRLMTLGILPERARRLLPVGDLEPVLQHLSGEWQSVKDRWGGT